GCLAYVMVRLDEISKRRRGQIPDAIERLPSQCRGDKAEMVQRFHVTRILLQAEAVLLQGGEKLFQRQQAGSELEADLAVARLEGDGMLKKGYRISESFLCVAITTQEVVGRY